MCRKYYYRLFISPEIFSIRSMMTWFLSLNSVFTHFSDDSVNIWTVKVPMSLKTVLRNVKPTVRILKNFSLFFLLYFDLNKNNVVSPNPSKDQP